MSSPPAGFRGRRILVTGGSSGIGLAVVRGLARRGARPAVMDLKQGEALPEDALFVSADVSRWEEVSAAVEQVTTSLGGLDGLVLNAGISDDHVLWKMDPASWRKVLGVNLDGAFYVLRAAVEALRESGRAGRGPAVVLTSSINALRGTWGVTNYSASKAGLLGLTRSAARELGKYGVRVNAVAPGFVRTPLMADKDPSLLERARSLSCLGKVAEPEDVAEVMLFLLGPGARHVTGEVIRVDGGTLA